MQDPTTPDDDAEVTPGLEEIAPEPVLVAPEPEPPVERRHDAFAVGLLSLIATLMFFSVLVGRENFYMRDLTRYYYPTKQILREIYLQGEIPYWNRLFSAGQPMAANPEHEVFYPLTWLILLPSYDLGYRLHILVHVYIGLLGMYALLRSMRARPPAAFTGALAFGLGGIYLSYINLLPILFCAAWIPLTCLYMRKFILAPRLRTFLIASLFLGLQFLVAEPTTVMQTGLILGSYALYRGWYSPRRWLRMALNVASVGAVSIAAFLVGAAQMLPAMDHVGDSARSRAFEFSLVSAWSLPWAKLAELIYPNILGHIAVDRVMWYWGGGLYPGMGSPFLFSIYCGLAITAFAVAAIFTRPRGSFLVLVLALFSLVLALGSNTPLLKFLYDHHIAASIRYPEKFILIAMFAVIIMAARLIDQMLRGDDRVREAALGFALAVTMVAVVVSIATFTPIYAKWFMRLWSLKPNGATTVMLNLSKSDWMIAAGRGIIFCALLATLRMIKRPIWLAAAGLFLVADLWLVVRELNPTMPGAFFQQKAPVAAALAKDHSQYRVFHEADWYGQEEIARQYFSTGKAVYWIVRNGLFPMTPAGVGVHTVLERDYDKTALIPTIDLVDSVWDVKRSGRSDWWEPFMAMSNGWYRGTYKRFEDERKRVKGDMTKAVPIRFLETKHYARYYFADQLVAIRDRQDFVKKLVGASYSDGVAFVQNGPDFVPAKGVVHRWSERPNSAIIDVETNGRAFLVMSVTPHKYWRITMDGRPAKSVVTNIGYQGVEVPQGRHRVEMVYRNDLVVRGLGISGTTTALLLIGLAVTWRRR